MCQLAAAAGAFYHCGLSRAAVHDKGSAQSRCRVCRRNSEQISILIQLLMMFCGVGSSRDRALSDDHHKAGSGYRKQVPNNSRVQRRHRKMWQSSYDGTDDLDSVPLEIECRAGRYGSHYGEKRPGELRHEAVAKQHECHNCRRQAKGRDVRLRQLSGDLQQLSDRI